MIGWRGHLPHENVKPVKLIMMIIMAVLMKIMTIGLWEEYHRRWTQISYMVTHASMMVMEIEGSTMCRSCGARSRSRRLHQRRHI